MSNTKKIKAGLVLQEPSEFVGQAGTLFYNPDTGSMYLSDGVTPGGIAMGQGGGGGGFSGNYNDLTNKPNLSAYANTTYVDNKATWANITGKPSLSTVATSGSYNDLSNKPSIPSLTGYATETYVNDSLSSKVDSTSLALVATSGNYGDLEYLPTISTVGHTGNYEDLHNKPSIPDVTGFATQDYVTTQGYITSDALTSYATQTWVEDRGYITSSALSSYATQSWVNDKDYATNTEVTSALAPYALVTGIPTDINQLSDADNLLGQGSGNPFDQDLNTSNNVTFNEVTLTAGIKANQATEIYTISQSGGNIDIYTDWDNNGVEVYLVHNDGVYITTDSGTHVWSFDNVGNLNIPGNLNANTASPAPSINGFESATFAGNLQAKNILANASHANLVFGDATPSSGPGLSSTSSFSLVTDRGTTNTTWGFTTDGRLVLPTGGDIVDHSGTSVLNGGAGPIPTKVSDLENDAGYITGWGQVDWTETAPQSAAYILNKPTIPTDIADLTDNSGLLGQGGGGTTYDQSLNTTDSPTFSQLTVNGSVNLPNGAEISATNSSNIDLYTDWFDNQGVEVYLLHNDKVQISTASGQYQWNFDNAGVFTQPNNIKQKSTGSVTCPPNADTVIYTTIDAITTTAKFLLRTEGIDDSTGDYDTQSCELIVARSGTKIAGSVYGLAYTSQAPLATFSVRWNSSISRIEVVCRPNSTSSEVSVLATSTEIQTSAI